MTDATGAPPRAAAARIVAAVVYSGHSPDDALARHRADLPGADQALAAAMAYGVLREHRYLSALIAPLLSRAPQPLLQALLLTGVYQLRAMRMPPHAAVHATVAATKGLGLPKARGMVNAVLRRYQREGERLAATIGESPGVSHSHPDWLVERIRKDWPQQWPEVLAANNQPAPMHLRVNRRATTRSAYLETLDEAGLEASPIAQAADGVTLATPVATRALPGFDTGQVSVQDGAAQLAVDLLDVRDEQLVLDACAAPGNKAAHLLERSDARLLALDIDPARLALLGDNLQRVQRSAVLKPADAAAPADWWDGRRFDRILLDAPCSGTGVIRRHPDIKWLRRESDIVAAAVRQRALLDALWPLLADDGQLVYATCSILRAEGVDVARAFLDETPGAQDVPIDATWGRPEAVGRRIAPGEHGFDGFYYARFRRVAALKGGCP